VAAAGVAPADARLLGVAAVAPVAAQLAAAEEVVAAEQAAPREGVAAGAAEAQPGAPLAVEAVAELRPAVARADAAVVAVRPPEVAAGQASRPAAVPSAAPFRPSSADRVAGSARRRTCHDRRRHGPASRFAPAAASSRSPSLPAAQHQFASSEVSPVFKPMTSRVTAKSLGAKSIRRALQSRCD